MARGGFAELLIEMSGLKYEAAASFELGNYRVALSKFKSALAVSQKNGDQVDAVDVHLLMIRCHEALHEVSRRSG